MNHQNTNAIDFAPFLEELPLAHNFVTELVTPRELNASGLNIIGFDKAKFSSDYLVGTLHRHTPATTQSVVVKHFSSSEMPLELYTACITEAGLVSQLSDEHVSCILGVITSGLTKYSIFELPGNGQLDLFLEITAGSLSFESKVKLSLDCASGMTYLSSKRIVHRFLAAKNVFVADPISGKIANFQYSAMRIDQNLYNTPVGQSMIPWCSLNALTKLEFDQQSDVWSFGVLMHEIFTEGRMLYNSLPLLEISKRILSETHLPDIQDATSEVNNIIRTIWIMADQHLSFSDLEYKLSELISSASKHNEVKNDTHPVDPQLPPAEYLEQKIFSHWSQDDDKINTMVREKQDGSKSCEA